MPSRVLSVALVLVAACSSAGADGEPGYETGPCVEGGCFGGLECLSDLCVEPEDVDDDDGPGGLDGGFVGTGVSDSATSVGMTSEPSESGIDPSSPTSPTSLTSNASADDTTGGESAESADETPDEGTTTGSSSTGGSCGNGDVDPGEQCEGNDLQGFDCASLGLGVGDLECDPVTCSFDTSMCMATTSATSSG